MNWEECLEHAAVTDIGMRRATNEDAYAIMLASDMEAWRQSGHLFVVADGIGAHAAGELASKMAVAGVSRTGTPSTTISLHPSVFTGPFKRRTPKCISGGRRTLISTTWAPPPVCSSCCRRAPWWLTWAIAVSIVSVVQGWSS